MGRLNHFFIPMACMEIFAKVMGMGEKMKYNANWRGAAPYDAQLFSLISAREPDLAVWTAWFGSAPIPKDPRLSC